MRLVILGDSHVTALGEGLVELKREGRISLPGEVHVLKVFNGPDTLERFFEATEGGVGFTDPRVGDALQGAISARVLVARESDDVYALSMGLMTTLFVRLLDWRRYVPAAFAPPTGKAMVVSEAVVRAIALSHNQHVLDFFAAVKLAGLRVVAISAPPLRLDAPVIADGGRPEVIQTLDRLARAAVANELARLEVPVVDPPDEAYGDGPGGAFLRPEFHRVAVKDHHHGNAAYGRLMVAKVLAQAVEMDRSGAARPATILVDAARLPG